MNWISIHALREEGDLFQIALVLFAGPISIHALREEGDLSASGRGTVPRKFLSTPSARRATVVTSAGSSLEPIFLSTPSARRATLAVLVESVKPLAEFLSTPSARRATTALTAVLVSAVLISIHALREEGDYTSPCP